MDFLLASCFWGSWVYADNRPIEMFSHHCMDDHFSKPPCDQRQLAPKRQDACLLPISQRGISWLVQDLDLNIFFTMCILMWCEMWLISSHISIKLVTTTVIIFGVIIYWLNKPKLVHPFEVCLEGTTETPTFVFVMYCYYSITTLKSLQVVQLHLLQFIDGIKKLPLPTLYQVLLLVFSARVL